MSSMEFIVQKKNILKSLLKVQGIAEKRTLMPILENVLIEAENGRMYFSVTDLEIGMHGSCEADVKEEGKIALLARKLLDIVKELGEEEISFKLDEREEGSKSVEILCGKTAFNISGKEHEGFPELPVYDDVDLFPINAEIMREMIRKTLFATSSEDKKGSTSGIFFEKEEEKIRMVSTDGHKLSLIEKEIKDGDYLGFKEGVIFPKKGMNEIRRILEEEKEQENIFFGLKGNNAVFKINNLTIIMRLIEEKYPKYRVFIPDGNDKNFIVNRELFLSSLKRVSLISTDKVKLIEISITKGKMSLISKSSDYGRAYDEIKVDYEGEDLKIGFNAVYLIEILNVIESNNILISLKDYETGAIIKSDKNDMHMCIIMPMIIPEEEEKE